MAELFEDLPLNSRVEVIYEREVSVETMRNSGVPVNAIPALALAALHDWYAVVDAEGDLVCLVPPGGICHNAHADDIAGARAKVVAAMLNQQAPSWPPDVRDLQLVTPRGKERVNPELLGGKWYSAVTCILVHGDGSREPHAARAPLNGRGFYSVTMICTFEDLQDADLMTWLRHDVAARLASGGKLTIRVV